MKKLFGVGALLCVTAGSANAQSSVTLFGVMDLSVRHVQIQGVGTVDSLASGANQTSRWGLRGTEDLGGGTSASFMLDSTIAGDTGSAGASIPAGQVFDRQSTLSLANARLGEIRMGRDYQPAWTAMSAFDPFITNGIAGISTSTMLSTTASRAINRAFGPSSTNANPILRVSNSLQYILPPNLGGVYGSLFLAAREGAANAAGGQTGALGGRVGYASGPVNVTVGTLTTRNTLVSGSNFYDTSLGGSYDFGLLKLAATHRMMKIESDKQATTMLAVSVPWGAGTFKASYVHVDQTGATAALSANDANLLGLGYVHDLSKRTALYTTYSRIANKGAATFTVPGGPSLGGTTFSGLRSSGYELGVRHFF